ncbi:MAG: DNA polymerase III subunit chi [Burkholderiaceae bacterium]|nr:DNA polymerase III subunit chi [Rhodoferax sp.]MCB2005394.1 DNA polymerase III subunit chi [Rhodoferax sp.]MCB2027527.1 DNA polymerase III subunit chi [Rhodoferax sp.]MCB2043504.1 DNA polymerase III subunit chi [Rhodoferax sp.]MCP5260320.1 DNA polymerase III subunit chi [Rhodoferax sp.]
MTEVAFHFNMPDKTRYLCRLLRKAVSQGAQVAVTGPDAAMDELDAALWSFSDTDFVPHCRSDSDPVVLDASPVVLGVQASQARHHDVLLNLGAEVPAGFERFERVIEVVGPDDTQRVQSRARWKYYQQRGYALVRHDLSGQGRS